jgi:predicted MFS family arabinose efflux permease
MSTVPVLVLVHEQTDSLTWLAIAAAARLLPYLIVSPFAGVLADRVRRGPLLLAAHASRCLLALGLAAAALAGAPVAVIIGLSFALTACGTPCFPAVLAALRDLVPDRELARATGAVSTVETAAFLAGPALGGVLLAATTATTAFVVDAVVLAAAMAFVPAGLGRGGDRGQPRLLGDLAEGGRALVANRPARLSLVAVVMVNVMGGMVSVLVVPMATQQLSGGSASAGLLTAAFGGGSVVGAALGAWRTRWSPIGALACASAPLVLAAPAGRAVVLWLLLAVAGAASTLIEVLMITRIQRTTPQMLVARVFGLFDAAVVSAILVGAAIAPLAVGTIGLRGTLLLAGLAVPLPAAYALQGAPRRSLRSAA